jgi:predicted anti-sigma-YlaC factor YlaD
MAIDCTKVLLEISNYLDDDVPPGLRVEIEAHFGECRRCSALVASLRNVLRLYGDERLFPLPEGFSARLDQRLLAASRESPQPARLGNMTVRTWWASAIAAGLMLAALLAGYARDRRLPALKSQHSEPAVRRPAPGTLVVVTDEGKTFHVASCPFIHGKRRVITAEEALREGYAPCVRCERALLTANRPAPRPLHASM